MLSWLTYQKLNFCLLSYLLCKTKTQKVKFCQGGLYVPKGTCFQFQNFCIKRKLLRPLFFFKLNSSKKEIKKQIMAATLLSWSPGPLCSCVVFYIHKMISWLYKYFTLQLKVKYTNISFTWQVWPWNFSHECSPASSVTATWGTSWLLWQRFL